MSFIEIDDSFDRLSPDEQRALDRALERWQGADGRDRFEPKPGLSKRALIVGYAVLGKLWKLRRLNLPEPPTPARWHVWHLRQADWKFEALAAKGSPVPDDLRGSTPESRRQLAMRAVENVEKFRRDAPPWWFDICARLMMDDPTVTD